MLAVFLSVAGANAVSAAETWHRADSHHFTIYSDGSAGQLEDFTHEVEKFDALLRMIFSRPAKDDPAKLTIYLLRNSNAVDALHKGAAGFYSVRLGQTFAVGNREFGGDRTDLSGKRVLFHEYAHHFMFHNFAIPAPAWFVEGFAEYVSTAEFKRNGDWTFGFPAHHRAYSVQNGPNIPIERLLSDTYSGMNGAETSAFYGWAWALTHMLYSDPNERGNQIMRYLRDINSGMDNLAAAEKNFGDLGELERSLRGYVRKSMGYSKSDKSIPYRDAITVTTLDDQASELVELTLDRLASPEPMKVRERLVRFAAERNSALAWLQLAELDYRLAHRSEGEGEGEAEPSYDFTAAQASVDRALAIDPDLARAHVLNGRILLEPFDHGEEADEADESLWGEARASFLAANRLDPRDPLALYLYAQTFQRTGERDAMVGPALETAFGFRPESTEFRSALAMHYASEGRYDSAIALLKIIANNPHSDNRSAKDAIARLEQAKAGGGPVPVGAIAIESEEDEEESGASTKAG